MGAYYLEKGEETLDGTLGTSANRSIEQNRADRRGKTRNSGVLAATGADARAGGADKQKHRKGHEMYLKSVRRQFECCPGQNV